MFGWSKTSFSRVRMVPWVPLQLFENCFAELVLLYDKR
jgi:hypothetical protein